MRGAQWFREAGAREIVDAGSGGYFHLAAAIADWSSITFRPSVALLRPSSSMPINCEPRGGNSRSLPPSSQMSPLAHNGISCGCVATTTAMPS
jgi:hypothetical protein